jgi:hypothetical protein
MQRRESLARTRRTVEQHAGYARIEHVAKVLPALTDRLGIVIKRHHVSFFAIPTVAARHLSRQESEIP